MNYQLKNDDLSVELTTKGGALTSIRDMSGREYLWQGDPKYWSGQAPVLFPICGSLRDDRAVTEDGKPVCMPRHGMVRKEEFRLESVSGDKISFSIGENESMLARYPYKFRLFLTYTLKEKNIQVTYGILNEGTVPMPFFIGGHPAFNCPLDRGEEYSDYLIVFEREENGTVPASLTETGLIDMGKRTAILDNNSVLPLSHNLFEKDAIIFDRLESKKIRYVHSREQKGIQLEFSQFPYLILWSSANHGPFIAMEPWSGLSTCSDEDDVLEHKRNVMFAKPGLLEELSYTITVL